jgi:hypothetical protein
MKLSNLASSLVEPGRHDYLNGRTWHLPGYGQETEKNSKKKEKKE